MDDSTLWVTGGLSIPNTLAATEYVSLDPSKRGVGPNLPKALHTHCLVKIDATHVMVIGMEDSHKKFSTKIRSNNIFVMRVMQNLLA